jgi:hypothetical protein
MAINVYSGTHWLDTRPMVKQLLFMWAIRAI